MGLSETNEQDDSGISKDETFLVSDDDGTRKYRTSPDGRSYIDFVKILWKTPGTARLLILCGLLSFGFGINAIVPAIASDRYARLYHGYTGPTCSTTGDGRAAACLLGSDNAQDAVAVSTVVQHGLGFVLSPIVGTASDRWGRRIVMIFGAFLFCVAPLSLVVLLLDERADPACFFVAQGLTGFASWFVVAFAAMADLVPPTLRAPSLSLVQLASFSMAATVPILAAVLGHVGAALVSCAAVSLGLLFAVCAFPETVTTNTTNSLNQKHNSNNGGFCYALGRPVRELSLLNRNRFFRLIAVVAFLSGMSLQADRTLLIFYLQGQLQFTDTDIAAVIVVHSAIGLVILTVLLERLIHKYGERYTLILAMTFGIMHNILYGVSRSRTLVMGSICVSGITGIAYPVVASTMANNVEEHEQGRLQGVNFSLNSLANAIGPISLQFIYNHTKNGLFFGPSSMFIVAAFFYMIGSFFACALPSKQTNSKEKIVFSSELRKGVELT